MYRGLCHCISIIMYINHAFANLNNHVTANLILKVIYKGSFKSFVALCADRICSDQHFVENCIEKFPSV